MTTSFYNGIQTESNSKHFDFWHTLLHIYVSSFVWIVFQFLISKYNESFQIRHFKNLCYWIYPRVLFIQETHNECLLNILKFKIWLILVSTIKCIQLWIHNGCDHITEFGMVKFDLCDHKIWHKEYQFHCPAFQYSMIIYKSIGYSLSTMWRLTISICKIYVMHIMATTKQ